MSDIATQCMSEHDARRLTERIRIAAVNYSEAKDKLMTLVQQAKEDAAHLALGYDSWQAYLTDTLGAEPMRIARDDGRPEMVRMLTDQGMSTRATAAVMGIDAKTVRNDLASTGEKSPVEPRVSHGMDGKTRVHQPKPEPERDVAKELDIINDIRLYFNAIASSRQVAGLTPAAKQHIIDAANNLITQLQKDQ